MIPTSCQQTQHPNSSFNRTSPRNIQTSCAPRSRPGRKWPIFKRRTGRRRGTGASIDAPFRVTPHRCCPPAMTAVLQSPSHLPSSPSSFSCSSNDGSHQAQVLLSPDTPAAAEGGGGGDSESAAREKGPQRGGGGGRGRREEERRRREEEDQLSLLALLVTAVRKSLVGCRTESDEDLRTMEIGWPTNVRHIAHVTFDRFHGFLGLPVEFEPEVSRRAPSASTSVFGVSTESMQCSYDPRGNSVPTILLLMQRRLYEQNGLQAEGIFRINAENSQEEQVRDQLNGGIVPAGIDVHCLAGLIKAWFRELPTAVLDSLTPEQVMQCQTEEECVQLVKLLPQTEAGLLDWAVNLMADVVQEELHNKMNARNVAMVFAPNMTQMADPLTALMYAVQVMNFLKTLILKTLKERQESILESASASPPEPSDENGHSIPSLREEAPEEEEREQVFLPEEPVFEDSCQLPDDSTVIDIVESLLSSQEKATAEQISYSTDEQPCELPMVTDSPTSNSETTSSGCNMADPVNSQMARKDKINHSTCNKGMNKGNVQSFVQASFPAEKLKEISLLSRINSRAERVEAWR